MMANLSSKELTALEEQLGSEKILISKYRTFASMASDPQIRSKCQSAADKHQEHYNKLQKHLN